MLLTLNQLFNRILNSRRKFVEKYKLFDGVLEKGMWLKNLKEHSYDLYIKLKKGLMNHYLI